MSLPQQDRVRRAIGLWLSVVGALIFLMVIVGGATRLTESGLSITEWNLVTGILPPLTEAGWERELAKYRTTSEYLLTNQGMSLRQFKVIYAWEWGHRLLGRVIGLAFLLPLLWFWWRGHLRGPQLRRLLIIFGLIVLQGVIGWWMVKSGLVGRTDVSPYRLLVHLGLAFVLFGLVMWAALDQFRQPESGTFPRARRFYEASLVVAALAFGQILLGALVAGTNAGFAYNTWPLMDGRLVPTGYFFLDPWWRNFFENIVSVQLNHRFGGYLLTIAVAVFWVWGLGLRLPPRLMRMLHVLAGVTLFQVVVGVLALVYVVPIALGILHQAGALLVFGASLHLAHRAGTALPRASQKAIENPFQRGTGERRSA